MLHGNPPKSSTTPHRERLSQLCTIALAPTWNFPLVDIISTKIRAALAPWICEPGPKKGRSPRERKHFETFPAIGATKPGGSERPRSYPGPAATPPPAMAQVLLLGTGSYGSVSLWVDPGSREQRAIKVVRKDCPASGSVRPVERARAEIAIHQAVSPHPNIVRLLDAYETEGPQGAIFLELEVLASPPRSGSPPLKAP